MIHAEIISDSIGDNGCRLTTFSLIYPRYIHAQLLTHRVFSRNTASSRAIPVKKMIEAIQENAVIPKIWGKNQSGMQSYEILDEKTSEQAKEIWLNALNNAIKSAYSLADLGVHKQFVNRLLEPFAHTAVILSGTDFQNFFGLRRWDGDIGASQHEIAELAEAMYVALSNSTPVIQDIHIPFKIIKPYKEVLLDPVEQDFCDSIQYRIESFFRLLNLPPPSFSVYGLITAIARCARVSYTTHTENNTFTKDIHLVKKLLEQKHCSPFEHVAFAVNYPPFFGNFTGWCQLRKILFNN